MFLWPQGMPSKLASKRLAVCTFPHRPPPFARPDPSWTFLKPILVLLSRLFWKAEAQALILPDASWAVPRSLLLRAWSLCASLPMGWCTQCYLYLLGVPRQPYLSRHPASVKGISHVGARTFICIVRLSALLLLLFASIGICCRS